AIFDSQVLAIFRRRKEMGTLMALGMTRGAIIRLFTIEGSLNGFLAVVIGAIYGIPFLSWFAKTGMSFPQETIDQFGMALAASIYPVYTLKLFLGTALLLFLTVVVVSFIPTRKITRLKPTDALRGKIS
ncbi:MAG: FtsX-like permease family protein, partial [Candidatus Marinimicrobia bacterium]|nr:FtsX-like permease family protein [Candidatus Neomarinimicrobiota bacterium]